MLLSSLVLLNVEAAVANWATEGTQVGGAGVEASSQTWKWEAWL